jgi:hypothetical protein
MNCNIILTEGKNTLTFDGEVSLNKLLAAFKAANEIIGEEKVIKTKKNVLNPVKTIVIPTTMRESIKHARSLGYREVTNKSFVSAHRVLVEMPKMVTSFGDLNGFITWYRGIEEINKPKKRIKDVSLERYFDEASK